MPNPIKIDVNSVLERYTNILKPCPECGEMMTPLGDPPMEPYFYCFKCKFECNMEGKPKGKKWQCRLCPESFGQVCDLTDHIHEKHLVEVEEKTE